MSILEKLASAIGRRDEVPNQELAAKIARDEDQSSVVELLAGLSQKAAIASDCIKVLYEVGYVNPKLIAPHANVFIKLLQHKNNRLQWGAMTALDLIASINPEVGYRSLAEIMIAADK